MVILGVRYQNRRRSLADEVVIKRIAFNLSEGRQGRLTARTYELTSLRI